MTPFPTLFPFLSGRLVSCCSDASPRRLDERARSVLHFGSPVSVIAPQMVPLQSPPLMVADRCSQPCAKGIKGPGNQGSPLQGGQPWGDPNHGPGVRGTPPGQWRLVVRGSCMVALRMLALHRHTRTGTQAEFDCFLQYRHMDKQPDHPQCTAAPSHASLPCKGFCRIHTRCNVFAAFG